MVLGSYLVYLGSKGKFSTPTITGVGFFVIAIAFLGLRK